MLPDIARYRFLLRPRWLALHVLIAILVVVMVSLGFWQLRRLDERRSSNAQIKARTSEQRVAVESAASPSTSGAALDALRYRSVAASGTYDASATSVIPSRTQSGAPGSWVVTPLRIGDDTVLVVRGFTPLDPTGTAVPPSPPTDAVTVQGYALAIDGFDNIAKHDLQTLRDERPGTLPVVVQATTSRPADDPALAAISLPTLDDGPHLGYAVQWFLFATVASIGYPFALRRAAGKAA
ncbi:MAG: SURF1 family protein [Acidimicrobiales bacterium]